MSTPSMRSSGPTTVRGSPSGLSFCRRVRPVDRARPGSVHEPGGRVFRPAPPPDPPVGIHSNMAGVVPADVWLTLVRNVLGAGGPPPSGLSEEESRTFEQLNFFFAKGVGYGRQTGTRP